MSNNVDLPTYLDRLKRVVEVRKEKRDASYRYWATGLGRKWAVLIVRERQPFTRSHFARGFIYGYALSAVVAVVALNVWWFLRG